jgi:hypothetical protein
MYLVPDHELIVDGMRDGIQGVDHPERADDGRGVVHGLVGGADQFRQHDPSPDRLQGFGD